MSLVKDIRKEIEAILATKLVEVEEDTTSEKGQKLRSAVEKLKALGYNYQAVQAFADLISAATGEAVNVRAEGYPPFEKGLFYVVTQNCNSTMWPLNKAMPLADATNGNYPGLLPNGNQALYGPFGYPNSYRKATNEEIKVWLDSATESAIVKLYGLLV